MSETPAPAAAPAKLEGGAYEVLRQRLESQGAELKKRLDALNLQRKAIFGGVESALSASERLTTSHNCVAQDLAAVGDKFIFGFNVQVGMKSEITPEDVFGVYEQREDGQFHEIGNELIQDAAFRTAFADLMKYYRKAKFIKLGIRGSHLYFVFRLSDSANDLKAFKWLMLPDGSLKYLDDRSVADLSLPPQQEFTWKRCTRDMHRQGKHPHISIEDKLFVECVGGDLTIKVEDNTADGAGIYSEAVENKDQGLDDAEIYYALVGSLILLKIKPFQEKDWRHFVFCVKTQTVTRNDALAQSCVLLPEDHGVLFPNGYALQNGEVRTFESPPGLSFLRRIPSPNGEDHLFVFKNRVGATTLLLQYNLITMSVATPIVCRGYTLFPDGKLIFFKADDEPKKHHMLQIWKTPFCASDFTMPAGDTSHLLYKIGNKDLVRCMSECGEILTVFAKGEGYADLYVDLVKRTRSITDAYFWLAKPEAGNLAEVLLGIGKAAGAAIDEFEKVRRIRKTAVEAAAALTAKSTELEKRLRNADYKDITVFVGFLAEIRTLRGETVAFKGLRYADLELADKTEKRLVERQAELSQSTVVFLLKPESLDLYRARAAEFETKVPKVGRVADAKKLDEELGAATGQLEMLTETVANLKIGDATEAAQIIDSISTVFARFNQSRSLLKNRLKELASAEGAAEFSAQLKLLSQTVASQLDLAKDPKSCEQGLARVMIALEELESRFSDGDEFLTALAEKRVEASEAFESKRVALNEARNKRSQALVSSADRVLKGISGRIETFKDPKDIHAYFAADPMPEKIGDLARQLRELGDTVRADDLDGRLKTLKETAVRQLKDRQELFVAGQEVVKLGKHQFSASPLTLDLAIIRRDEAQFFHLTGTRYFDEVKDPRLAELRNVWDMEIPSENPEVARIEFLAWQLFRQWESGKLSFSGFTGLTGLSGQPDVAAGKTATTSTTASTELLPAVQTFMAPLYSEGYVKGIHDVDAAQLLAQLIDLAGGAGLLRHPPANRALASLWWSAVASEEDKALLSARCASFALMREAFPSRRRPDSLVADLAKRLADFAQETPLIAGADTQDAAEYLFAEICRAKPFTASSEATAMIRGFESQLRQSRLKDRFDASLGDLRGDLRGAWRLASDWLEGFADSACPPEARPYLPEAAALLLLGGPAPGATLDVKLVREIGGLVSSHPRIVGGKMTLALDEFCSRLRRFETDVAPRFRSYQQLKIELADKARKELRLADFQPKVLSSFVRNRLVDEVYLPLVGDNLAKQIGTVGVNKRTDLMGMLLLISPPGYGKTTLMEYLAHRLGLVFVKINAPAMGHAVTSLDPQEAPNAAARDEVNKLNLALEMGDNVMILVDDIQHANPEFLQKFISLCDGQRRIEGVWRGQPKTYDMRGRRLVVCMAGNPYTESGEKFKIPDMLANRADTYNLGDIIGETAPAFRMSYMENAVTSNPSLRPLTTAPQKDIRKLIEAAESGERANLELEINLSSEELGDILAVFKHLSTVRDTLFAVNQEYILSAAQQDAYRTEPAFKLQGSYRNMAKITEKVVPLMEPAEIEVLIDTHYQNESQTLAAGAESNLLRFAEMRGRMSDKQKARFEEIRSTFRRNQRLKGMDGSDPMALVASEMATLNSALEKMAGHKQLNDDKLHASISSSLHGIGANLPQILETLAALPASPGDPRARIEVVNTVPDFLASLLKRQIDLMNNWAQTCTELARGGSSKADALLQDIEANKRAALGILGRISDDPTPAAVNLNCPKCEAVLDVAEYPRGSKVSCPKCAIEFVIPET